MHEKRAYLAPLTLTATVGQGGPNRPADVKAIQNRLNLIGIQCGPEDGRFSPKVTSGIASFQRRFMVAPTGVIEPHDDTYRFLCNWTAKRVNDDVVFKGQTLRDAWELVSPLLPPGSRLTSAYRSQKAQRDLVLKTYLDTSYKARILHQAGKDAYDKALAAFQGAKGGLDQLAAEKRMVALLNDVGRRIGDSGSSLHCRGQALDIGGEASMEGRKRVFEKVARANPNVFSGLMKEEGDGGRLHVALAHPSCAA